MTATSAGMKSHRVPVVHNTGYLIATYADNERSQWELPCVDPEFTETVISDQAAALMARIINNAALARKS